MKELLLSYTVYSVPESIREYRGYVVFVLPILWVGSQTTVSVQVLTGGLLSTNRKSMSYPYHVST
jgi:hypothetical protein